MNKGISQVMISLLSRKRIKKHAEKKRIKELGTALVIHFDKNETCVINVAGNGLVQSVYLPSF